MVTVDGHYDKFDPVHRPSPQKLWALLERLIH